MIALTLSDDVDLLDRAVVAGVRGIVRKSDPPPVFLKAIDKVHQGEFVDRPQCRRPHLR